MNKPYIGIPLGDPAGIGPEIVLKSMFHQEIFDVCNPVVIGDASILEYYIKKHQYPLTLHKIAHSSEGIYLVNHINLIEVGSLDMNKLVIGQVQAESGKASFEYIKKSVELSNDNQIDAIATTPINKESLKAAQVPFIGHTEIYASLSDTPDPLTMFEIEKLRVFFLSRHVSLKKAIEMVKKDRIIDYVKRSHEALRKLGVSGTIAVAGLNPHSGEHGLFGYEEMDEIIPAIEELQKQGYDCIGPVPADSVFAIGLSGKYAAILSLYHDQGHIATKTYDFHRTISLTNGMPFLRTSVDHGTALDIAGKNIANEVSMVEAILIAAKYAPNFKKQ